MEFILKGKPYVIKSAELFATIPSPHWRGKFWPFKSPPEGDLRIFWSLEVWADVEQHDEEVDDQEPDSMIYPARASAEEMHFPIHRWVDVAGQTVEWAGLYDEKTGGPYGGFYLGEHESIGRARLRFAERDGTAFRFEWEGVCNVYLDGENRRDVPFSASGWARFTGVTVNGNGADTDESVQSRLAQYLDPRDFVQERRLHRKYRDGFFRRGEVSFTKFTPTDASAA